MWQVKYPEVANKVHYVALLRAAIWCQVKANNVGPTAERNARQALREYLADFDYSWRVVEAASSVFTEADNTLFAKLELPLVAKS